jgi:pyruvate dehydrogenase E1 component alpha subunit
MNTKWTKENLITFENGIAELFNKGKCPYPIHFSGGNEEALIDLFKMVDPEDWVFSTHRSHYHYLLKGGDPDNLLKIIMRGDSLHVYDKSINFFSSAIVAGCPTIAAGVAMSGGRVWCFIGDGAESEGAFYEAVRFADIQMLPITFVIEDNGLCVDTPCDHWPCLSSIRWPDNVIRYGYKRKYPHVGTGHIVKEYM